MKNLLLFLAAISLLVSCNQDADNNFIATNSKKYKASFAVNGFAVQGTSLDSESDKAALPSQNYCQYVIYSQTGNVVKDSVIEAEHISSGRLTIEEELPLGTYHITIFSAKKTARMNNIFYPSNYNTDYCQGNLWLVTHSDNENVYYETFTFTVDGKQSEPVNVLLEPMWSNLNIEITDAATFVLPEGTTHLFCEVSPYFTGFFVKTKKPKSADSGEFLDGDLSKIVNVEEFRAKSGLYGRTNIAASENVSVSVVFIQRSDELQSYVQIGKQPVYTGSFDKGYDITLSGKLGNIQQPQGSQRFNVLSKPFIN